MDLVPSSTLEVPNAIGRLAKLELLDGGIANIIGALGAASGVFHSFSHAFLALFVVVFLFKLQNSVWLWKSLRFTNIVKMSKQTLIWFDVIEYMLRLLNSAVLMYR